VSRCSGHNLRPWPMMIEITPQRGQSRGSHSASYLPGSHPVPEHGIKTIAGSEGNRPGVAIPSKATGSAAPPSLLSIGI
jgi:hypothetical protein